MSKQLNKVKKRLESRRREIQGNVKQRERTAPMLVHKHEDAREEPDFYVEPGSFKSTPPLKKGQDHFLIRAMLSVCIFLIIAIMFKTGAPQFEGVRQFVKGSYEQEFQFAAVANWYENQFGRPLALLPEPRDVALGDVNEEEPEAEMVYAVPASGQISEGFEQNGRGVYIETGANTSIEAAKGGYVITVGGIDDEEIGKAVVVQHYDGTESIYGLLNDIHVNMYDHIQAGHEIGTVSTNEEGRGVYYFALKQGDQYIDPSDVISFE
ncbi:inhibitor of SpoIVFB [Alkalihalophilus pseudofirmus OF4]|uniref:Inhibitor of SpoIVFB n=2 Tax=Alkalihalophilus pseudofirmus TaxID=79885 RepID=D3FW85_ALKPO|nr:MULTISPECIES: M23 family metallopeptidase [Alkalihalophilus]ADC48617.1 inhibitor of SpoIVFB [Alkalihalophilus pseudofirmus OF4]MDV2885788.1 M23 family metallopeptidase [Alkalihalophilus pseudofirmus]MED1602950.1 M23 family metallopeptidase [Alkalihalophilus marmarensis]WEG16090.1 M23 family metallopeptidase [Alkalihalophilus pseudofirmus]